MDPDDGIDYDELFEELHADILSGRFFHGPFAFNSADYATEDEVQVGLRKFFDDIHKEVMDELAAERAMDAARAKRR